MKTRAVACAALLMCLSSAAFADQDRVILSGRSEIEQACQHITTVSCQFIAAADIDRAGPDATLWVPDSQACSGPSLPVPSERIGLIDRMAGKRYCAQALIYERTSGSGAKYSMVRMAVLGIIGSAEPRWEAGKDDIAWAEISKEIVVSDRGDAPAIDYLQKLDDAENQRAAMKAAQQADAAARSAYLSSDAYKRDSAAAAVASCRKTIINARKAIEHDERIAKISGYENKMMRESAAMAIVQCEDVIAAGGAPRM